MKILSQVTSLAILTLIASSATADVVYTYTGTALDVTYTNGAVTALPTQVTGEFTVPAPILGGPGLFYNLSEFTSWSFSDGLITITNQTAMNPNVFLDANSTFLFSSTGQVALWFVSLNERTLSVPSTRSVIETAGSIAGFPPGGCFRPFGLPFACYADDGQSFVQVPPPQLGGTSAIAATVSPGRWSGPPVGAPEPESLSLILLGLAFLLYSRRTPRATDRTVLTTIAD